MFSWFSNLKYLLPNWLTSCLQDFEQLKKEAKDKITKDEVYKWLVENK